MGIFADTRAGPLQESMASLNSCPHEGLWVSSFLLSPALENLSTPSTLTLAPESSSLECLRLPWLWQLRVLPEQETLSPGHMG